MILLARSVMLSIKLPRTCARNRPPVVQPTPAGSILPNVLPLPAQLSLSPTYAGRAEEQTASPNAQKRLVLVAKNGDAEDGAGTSWPATAAAPSFQAATRSMRSLVTTRPSP